MQDEAAEAPPHHPLLRKAEIEASLEFAQNGLAPETGCLETPLGDKVGLQDVGYGVNFVRLEPNKQAWPIHFHMNEYEWVYITAGSAMYRQLDATDPAATVQETRVEAGDYIGWPAGLESAQQAHALRATDEGCEMLCGGSRSRFEIVGYPQHDRSVIGDRTRDPHRRKILPGLLADLAQEHPRDSQMLPPGAAPPHCPVVTKAEIESRLQLLAHSLMPESKCWETGLSDITGFDKAEFGINFVRCESNMLSCPAHYHINESEFIYLLNGSAILTHIDSSLALLPGDGDPSASGLGDASAELKVETIELRPGDFVGWPRGHRSSQFAHSVTAGPEGAEWICGGNRAAVEICAYPQLRIARMADYTGKEKVRSDVPHY